MTAGTIIYITANALLTVWLAYVCLLNPIIKFCIRREWSNTEGLSGVILITVVLIHALLYISLSLLCDAAIVVLISAGLLLHWSLLAYFSLQRYCDILKRPGFVMEHPSFLAICLVLSILSSVAAIIVYARWYYLPIVIVVWGVYGICCAERAIAHLKANGYSRELAYSALTRKGLKLRSFYLGVKYPFP